MEIDREKLAAVTKAVFNAYARRRRMFHEGWCTSPRWDQFWMKTADALIRAGIDDPCEYIDMQFDTVKPFPRPNQLHGATAVQSYVDWKHARMRDPNDTQWHRQVHYELSYMTSRYNVFGASVHVDEAQDPATDLSPLFRVLWAMRHGVEGRGGPVLWDKWMKEAKELLHNKDAVKAYRDCNLLTDELAARIANEG